MSADSSALRSVRGIILMFSPSKTRTFPADSEWALQHGRCMASISTSRGGRGVGHQAEVNYRFAPRYGSPNGRTPVVDPDLKPFAADCRVHDAIAPRPCDLPIVGCEAEFVDGHSVSSFQPQEHQSVRILVVSAREHDVGLIGGNGERAIYAIMPKPHAAVVDPNNGKVGVRAGPDDRAGRAQRVAVANRIFLMRETPYARPTDVER